MDTGIQGNEIADDLANLGRDSIDKIKIKLDYKVYLLRVKEEIWKKWVVVNNTIFKSKGKFYMQVVEKINKIPWFKKCKFWKENK